MARLCINCVLHLCLPAILICQVDTLRLRNEVYSITTPHDHQQFWKNIQYKDQDLRKRNDINSIDFENLISSCYYFTRFGYPDPVVCGKEGLIISTIWVHNRFNEVSYMTFPIVLEGYSRKLISEDAFRNYFMRNVYQMKFDDTWYLTASIGEILQKLEISLSGLPPVEQIYIRHLDLVNYFDQQKDTLGCWIRPSVNSAYMLNADTIPYTIPGRRFCIYRMPDDSLYLEDDIPPKKTQPLQVIAFTDSTVSGYKIESPLQEYHQLANGNLVKVRRHSEIRTEYIREGPQFVKRKN